MHVIVNQKAMLKELTLMNSIITSKNSFLPVLTNVRLDSMFNEFTLSGTDLDVSLVSKCGADVKLPGSICINARKLFDIFRNLAEADVDIKCDKGNVIIKCQGSQFKIPEVSTDHFPEIKKAPIEFVQLQSSILSNFISRTLITITKEESRFALSGIKFELSIDNIRMVSTDGHRLSFIESRSECDIKDGFDAVVPHQSMRLLLKLIDDKDSLVEISRDENHIYFKVNNRTITSRILFGEFPNYEMVIPKENSSKFNIDSNQISNAIRRVALMADERSHGIKMIFSDGCIEFFSQSAESGEAKDSITIENQGKNIDIGFNAKYLMEFFDVISEEFVSLELKDSNTQALLRPLAKSNDSDTEKYSYIYVLMPMRI